MGTFVSMALVCITLALVFYSVGIWAERLQKMLKLWHIVFFVLGFVADYAGTAMMGSLSKGMVSAAASSAVSGSGALSLHGITGTLALLLMLVHALWAIWTYWRGSLKAKQNFSKFSVFVWAFWLIPYIGGILLGMSH